MLGIDEGSAIDLLEANGWNTDRAAELHFLREANPTPEKGKPAAADEAEQNLAQGETASSS